MKKTNKIIVKAVLAISLALTSACNSSSSEFANISLRLSNSQQVVSHKGLFGLLFNQANAANYGDIRFCFKRLRFKLPEVVLVGQPTGPIDDSSGITELEDNVDIELGEVVIDPQGTDIGSLQVPAGDYVSIEFDLESDCLSGHSVQLTNNQGSFTSEDQITIKYDGNFNVVDGAQINLPLAEIIAALDGFNSTATIQQEISQELESLLEGLSINVSDDY